MSLRTRTGRGEFVTIIEVFPPSFNLDPEKEPSIGIREKARDFLERVKRVHQLADAILIAEVKDASRLKLSTVHSAALLKEELGIESIPVITARDSNRAAVRSTVLTALSLGIDSVMLVWGDKFTDQEGTSNVYDYRSLSEMISETRRLAERAEVDLTILAPVDLSLLLTGKGLRMTEKRLHDGASLLLAQPPTTDASSTLSRHIETVRGLDLGSRILLNVFPFRSKQDVDTCRVRFGWDLPPSLDYAATGGEPQLLKEARRVSEGIRNAGIGGVYVSTRGKPELARFILD